MRLAVATAAALVALALPADAGRLPTPVLTATGGTQEGGAVWTFETSYDPRKGCLGENSNGPGESAFPLRHDANKGFVIRLPRPDAPVFLNVVLERVPSGGYAPFLTMSVSSYELRPVRVRGKVVAWDVVVPPPGVGIPPPAVGDVRVTLIGRWRGECSGEDRGYWRFHLLVL